MRTRYLIDEVAIGRFSGDDNVDGIATYASPVVYPARIEDKQRLIRSPDGTEVMVSTWVALQVAIGPRDRVWIAPIDNANNGPRVFAAGYVYVDADARTPVTTSNARRRDGREGHCEAFFA